MSLAKPVMFLVAAISVSSVLVAGQSSVGGSSRWATFDDPSGTQFFALSMQPSASGDIPLPDRYEVVLLVDTSATQTGPVRLESMEVVEELVTNLPAGSSIALLACDVKTVAMSDGMVQPTSPQWASALAKLKNRVPLGTTNLGLALKTADAQFSQSVAQRVIVYVGDGVNRLQFLSVDQHRELIAQLVKHRVSVNSLAIGPVVDIATLAAIANHTGGVLFSRDEISASTQEIGRALAKSVAAPVMWPVESKLPASVASFFPAQFPPLRVDRDSVIVGKVSGQSQAGALTVSAMVADKPVALRWNLSPEASHPDMAFLPSVLEMVERDNGLSLPALGSSGLKAMSLVLADSSQSMVKSGQFALKSGKVESAVRIAQEALKQDPNNVAAQSLLNAAKKEAEKTVPAGKFMQAPVDPFAIPEITTNEQLVPAPTPAAPATPVIPAAPQAFAPPSTPSLLDETFSAGSLLADEVSSRRLRAEALDQDVSNRLRSAQEQSSKDPLAVKNSLKAMLEELDQTVDLDPAHRARLRDQVQTRIQIVAQKEADFNDKISRANAIDAGRAASERLLAETERRESSLQQLVENFNYLMAEHRYLEASKEVAPAVSELSRDTSLDSVIREKSSIVSNYALVIEAFEEREQGFVDSMRGVEQAAVPFAGEPPIVYPPAEVWQALSARRKERYGSIDLAGSNLTERRIFQALKNDVEPAFNGLALRQVLQQIGDDNNIPIYINQSELDALGADADSPITLTLPKLTLRSALRLMLQPLDLTYVVRNEVLEITSQDNADDEPINKVYPVGDLVIPPSSGGGMMGGMMGGMGGGMGGMGGGMGGMGGGMGGMGGGMGGMGGGMGGMGGGMGGMGGMFAVPDEVAKPRTGSPATKLEQPLPTHRGSSTNNWDSLIERFVTASEQQRSVLDAEVREIVRECVAKANDFIAAKNESAALEEFEKVNSLINGLLRAGYPQPWMYQALSFAMQACKYPTEELERVLLSSLDFRGSPTQSVQIAQYLSRHGMKLEALGLLKDVAMVEPFRYDVYALALPLARETKDVEALKWTCLGVLSKAWPDDYASLAQDANVLARVTASRLLKEGRVVESKAFESQVQQALRRDLVVRVSWTGDADIDLRVQEPAGTICSLSNRSTVGGGILLGDESSSGRKATIDGFSEFYVCPQGFAGQYDVLVRRVWGKVSGGKATVEILSDYGTPDQKRIVQNIDLNEKDAIVSVAVQGGQRQEPIAQAHLASIHQKQLATARSVLGQFVGSSSGGDSGNVNPFGNFQRQLAGFGGGFPFRGAVGYQPQITTLSEGASNSVTGVVSADRRYVRISPQPFFNGIGEVFTFNFVSGQGGGGAGTTGGQGGGGFGGGAGGIGGGGGGGFGGGGGGGVF